MPNSVFRSDVGAPALEKFDRRALKIFQLESSKAWIDAYPHSMDDTCVTPEGTPGEKSIPVGDRTCPIRYPEGFTEYKNHPQPAFFIRFTLNSNSRLSPSRVLFEGLMDCFSINPRFKEFIMSFGYKNKEYDFAPPACRFRLLYPLSPEGCSIKGYECAYGLRYVADNGNPDGRERWSIRQYAVYQKHDPPCNQVIWVFVGIPKESSIEKHVMDHIRKHPFTNSMHSFALHLTLIEASIFAWRWYLNDMTERVQDQSDRITLADVAKDKIDGLPEFNIDFRDRQRLKTLEDAILNLEIMLSSTIGTISCLMDSLSKPMGQQNGDSSTEETLCNGFSEILNETKLYLTKAQVLEKRIQGASALLSGLLDYENAYSLRLLAEEARNDNMAMRNLTEKATKDSGAIKIITIITVFFLPATVVASFFSTQFVSISAHNLVLSTKWWIYFAITGPLTIFTLLVWYITSSTHVQDAVLHRLRKARLIRNLATDIPRINSERASSITSRTLGIPG